MGRFGAGFSIKYTTNKMTRNEFVSPSAEAARNFFVVEATRLPIGMRVADSLMYWDIVGAAISLCFSKVEAATSPNSFIRFSY